MRCAIYGAFTSDVELRLGHFGDAPLRSLIVPDIDSARLLAQDWLEAVRAASNPEYYQTAKTQNGERSS